MCSRITEYIPQLFIDPILDRQTSISTKGRYLANLKRCAEKQIEQLPIVTPFKRFQLSVVLLILSTIESQNFIKLREYASITLQFWGSASLLASSHVSQSTMVEGQKIDYEA